MGLFAISYDLIKRKDYPELWTELERIGAHKALESFYLANLTTDDPAVVRDHLKPYIDNDDMLMVVRFVGRPAFVKAKAGTNKWIEANCP